MASGVPSPRRSSRQASAIAPSSRRFADGLQIADLKYAHKALMNAVYLQGRDDIRGSDNGSFCQIWASTN